MAVSYKKLRKLLIDKDTLDRIKQISETDHIIIKGWDHNDLALELAKHPSLSAKYFGI